MKVFICLFLLFISPLTLAQQATAIQFTGRILDPETVNGQRVYTVYSTITGDKLAQLHTQKDAQTFVAQLKPSAASH